jgi:hypothetical protein
MSRGDNTLQRLYSARAAIAYAISLDGEVYGPLLERIEREIAARHDSIDVVSRALSILDEPEVKRIIRRTTRERLFHSRRA